MTDTDERVERLRRIVASRCDAQCTTDLDSLTAELALKERVVEELLLERCQRGKGCLTPAILSDHSKCDYYDKPETCLAHRRTWAESRAQGGDGGE